MIVVNINYYSNIFFKRLINYNPLFVLLSNSNSMCRNILMSNATFTCSEQNNEKFRIPLYHVRCKMETDLASEFAILLGSYCGQEQYVRPYCGTPLLELDCYSAICYM
jgi:hypothetical protein